MDSDVIEWSIKRGVWFWCFLSAILPSGGITTATGLLSIPVGLGLRSSSRRTVTAKTALVPEKRDKRLLLSYAITSACGLGLYGTSRLVFRRWNPLLVASVAFGLSQVHYFAISMFDTLGVSSETMYKFGAARERVSKAVMDRLVVNPPSRHPLIRYPLLLCGYALMICWFSGILVLSTFQDFRQTVVPVVRRWLCERRLRLRRWANRSKVIRFVAGTTPKYTYRPLNNELPSIRLLKLLPRRPFGAISCELTVVSVQDLPTYEAVSYTWGEGEFEGRIHIDGKVLPVSPTVEALLFQLSSYTKSRFLWIDQICINQSDKAEKTKQIPLMRDIYHKASNVIVWLDKVKDAWKARGMLAFIWHEYVYGTTESCAAMIRLYSTTYPEAGWAQLMNIFAHPWFYRIWVVQEVVLASSVTVLASEQPLQWDHLATFSLMISSAPFNEVLREGGFYGVEDHAASGLSNMTTMALLRNAFQESSNNSVGRSMEVLMDVFSNLRCTLPVDRIYGLLGLVDPDLVSRSDWLEPDYNRTTEEIYTEVAKNLMQHSGDWDKILSFAGIGHRRNLASLPSWVPDWTYMSLLETRRQSFTKIQYTARFNASGRVPPHLSFLSTRPPPELSFVTDTSDPASPATVMVTKGHVFDEILHLTAVHTYTDHDKGEGTLEPEDILSVIKPHLAARKLTHKYALNPYPTDQPLDEAFWRTIVGDTDLSRPANPSLARGCRTWERVITAQAKAVLPESERDDEELVDETNEVMSVEEMVATGRLEEAFKELLLWNSTRVMCCTGRAFCITKKGYMAMVPPGSEKGDLLCILYGMNTPYVLRPCQNEPVMVESTRGEQGSRRRVQLVGEAYVHGIMDGEAMGMEGRREGVFEVR